MMRFPPVSTEGLGYDEGWPRRLGMKFQISIGGRRPCHARAARRECARGSEDLGALGQMVSPIIQSTGGGQGGEGSAGRLTPCYSSSSVRANREFHSDSALKTSVARGLACIDGIEA